MCTDESIEEAADLLSALCAERPEGVHRIVALVGNPQMAPHQETDALVGWGSARVVITESEVNPDSPAEAETLFRMVSMMRHEEVGGYLMYIHADVTPPAHMAWRVLPEGVLPLKELDLLALRQTLCSDPGVPRELAPPGPVTLKNAPPVPEGVL